MINFNGNLQDNNTVITNNNRAYAYGDGLFETIKAVHGKLLFFEDHYFRLMASMRIMRMEIPMSFTLEFLQDEILKTIKANQLDTATCRVKLQVHRVEGGLYEPESNDVEFIVSVKALDQDFYLLNEIYLISLIPF